MSKPFISAGGSKSQSLALYLFKQNTPGGSMHVYQLIEVVEKENGLLQNVDGFSGASHALTQGFPNRL